MEYSKQLSAFVHVALVEYMTKPSVIIEQTGRGRYVESSTFMYEVYPVPCTKERHLIIIVKSQQSF